MGGTGKGRVNTLEKYWVVLFLGVMSIILAAVAYVVYEGTQSIVRNGAAATGTVTGLSYSSSGRRGSVYYPIVKFETASGDVLEERGQLGSSPASYKVGDKVEIYYLKSDPKSWVINGWGELYFLPAIFGLFASILAVVTVVCAHSLMRGRPFPGTFAAKRRRK